MAVTPYPAYGSENPGRASEAPPAVVSRMAVTPYPAYGSAKSRPGKRSVPGSGKPDGGYTLSGLRECKIQAGQAKRPRRHR
ncbi:hypothetical protein RVW32_003323 [Citrobacter amalonaticus]|nr:hypothetical protein [Citrobacter amalonaticus]